MPSSATAETYLLSLHAALPICSAICFTTALDRGSKARATTRPFSWSTASSIDRKSTRLNSSHLGISYAVFCDRRDLSSFPTRRSSDLFGDLLHDGLGQGFEGARHDQAFFLVHGVLNRSEEHTSELQSLRHLVCRLLRPPRPIFFPYTPLFRSVRRFASRRPWTGVRRRAPRPGLFPGPRRPQ